MHNNNTGNGLYITPYIVCLYHYRRKVFFLTSVCGHLSCITWTITCLGIQKICRNKYIRICMTKMSYSSITRGVSMSFEIIYTDVIAIYTDIIPILHTSWEVVHGFKD